MVTEAEADAEAVAGIKDELAMECAVCGSIEAINWIKAGDSGSWRCKLHARHKI